MQNFTQQIHTFKPIFQSDAKILILGSFPSVKSREQAFYYGHPQNRFWRIIASVTKEDIPQTIADKQALLYRKKIALWDVVYQCEIIGSKDQSIKNEKPNDLSIIFSQAPIQRVYTNGQAAGKLYKKYFQEDMDCEMTVLPSTSPANATYSFERLVQEWQQITE